MLEGVWCDLCLCPQVSLRPRADAQEECAWAPELLPVESLLTLLPGEEVTHT